MALVSLQGVSVAFGARRLLDAVSLGVAPGTRMALVGPNGSGKTTLLRVMAGLAAPDAGTVVRERDTRIGYVPQSGVAPAGRTLSEEAETAFADDHALVEESRAIEERLARAGAEEDATAGLLARHAAIAERLEASGYHRRAEQIERVLAGLGFARGDFERGCGAFSAGWQMRVALARTILERPDILLLDEPTNYLDLEARTWLEEHLRAFPGGVLLVSHDRYFLDVTVSRVAEIWMSRVSVFAGTYTHYEEVRRRELEAIMERYRLQQEEIARVEAFIRRFRYNSSKARLVQSRVNWLERLERIEVPPVVKRVRFSFPAAAPSGRLAVAAEALAKSYTGRPVFAGVDLEVERGERLVVVGVNGAGKSTLLRILAGRETADAGAVIRGTGVALAWYSQELADAWASDRTVIEEVESAAPIALVPELRNMLGAFLFRGDDILKPVSVLSGGEKSRLSMLLLLLKPSNLLVLDEPTNHLDIASKDVLLGALSEFPGTVVFVSHDRAFIEGLATSVLEMRDGRARLFKGGYEYYLRKTAADAAAAAALPDASARSTSAPSEPPSASALERQEEKRLKSELRGLEREEGETLARLDALEDRRRAIEEEMADPLAYADGERMRTLGRDHAAAVSEHERLMAAWEDLGRRIAALKERLGGLRTGTAGR
jgi:ATP-binding cassette, subfamily F, member 3